MCLQRSIGTVVSLTILVILVMGSYITNWLLSHDTVEHCRDGQINARDRRCSLLLIWMLKSRMWLAVLAILFAVFFGSVLLKTLV
jgi:hypothetical protein